jgi:thiol-disulfide isomerase/thioredoxin
MKWLLALLMILTPGSPWFMKWAATRKVHQHVGSEAPDTSAVDGFVSASRRVYYFHAPYCGPCKAMMPFIDEVRQTHPNLIKVDVSQHAALAQAFGVSATPSFIVVTDNHVTEAKIGSPRKAWIRNMLGDNT